AAGHRAVPGERRAGARAGRLARLHLRPHRGRGAPRAAGGLLLPARDPDRPGRPGRARGPPHGGLATPPARPVQVPRHPRRPPGATGSTGATARRTVTRPPLPGPRSVTGPPPPGPGP